MTLWISIVSCLSVPEKSLAVPLGAAASFHAGRIVSQATARPINHVGLDTAVEGLVQGPIFWHR